MPEISKKNKLTIIIPVSSKELHAQFFLDDLVNKLRQDQFFLDWPYQIIIVINGSRPRRVIDQIAPLYNENPHLFTVHVLNKASYGEALKMGLTKSQMPIVASFDIDFWDVDFLRSAVKNIIDHDYDIVIASKNIRGSSDHRSFLRKWISLGFSYLLKNIFNINISDTHGIKVWNVGSKMRYLFDISKPFDHMYDSEIIIRAALLKFKIL